MKLDGTFVKSLAVKEPGDTDSLDGYRKQDVFSGMTAGTYTGDQYVMLYPRTSGSILYYELNNGDWALYTQAIKLSASNSSNTTPTITQIAIGINHSVSHSPFLYTVILTPFHFNEKRFCFKPSF